MEDRKKIVVSVALATVLAFGAAGCGGGDNNTEQTPTPAAIYVNPFKDVTARSQNISDDDKKTVLETYAKIALANYTDAWIDAKALKTAIKTFTDTPNDANFVAAKKAWLIARGSYGTTEIFRLSKGPIDADGAEGTWVEHLYGAPEGEINAWPLDENMIDETKDANGAQTSGNIIDTVGIFTPVGGVDVNVTTITKDALSELNENGGDANVATGYHAIEFLLWGQDQDYSGGGDTVTNGPLTAGERPLTDYTSAANADRRKAYLNAAADLMVDDLSKVVDGWNDKTLSSCDDPDHATGCYRNAFLGATKGVATAITTREALSQVFTGMSTFLASELANERVLIAVQGPSEEDEHSCFSDNTHRDIALNYQGFMNVLKGEYKGVPQGKSIYSLLSNNLKAAFTTSDGYIVTKINTVDETAKTTMHFDYQIKDGSSTKDLITNMVYEMKDMGNAMPKVATEFGL